MLRSAKTWVSMQGGRVELWREVVGYEKLYIVSSKGRIRSLDRKVICWNGYRRCTKIVKEKPLIPAPVNTMYTVRLRKDGVSKGINVGRLVLEAFVGPCPEGMECCHFPDRNRSNNCLWNLQWGSRQTNHLHQIIHGTTNKGKKVNTGENNGMSKLDYEKAAEIRKLYENGYRVFQLARRFIVSASTIVGILKGRSWVG